MLSAMPYYRRPKLNFYGIVLGICPHDEEEMYSVIFCTASKPEKKVLPWVIKILQPREKAEAINGLIPGQLVQVKCEYSYDRTGKCLADDCESHILASLAVDWIKILNKSEIDERVRFQTHKFPSLGRSVVQDALAHHCENLDEWVDIEWVDKYSSFPEFSLLLLSKLKEPGTSLLTIDCCCLVIQRLPSTFQLMENKKPESLCLALFTEGYPVELPTVMSMGFADEGTHLAPIYNVSNVPIIRIDSNDYFSIIRCGKAESRQALNEAELKTALPILYDNLYNLLWGTRVGLPTLYPKRKTVDKMPELLRKLGNLMSNLGVRPENKVHGWWGTYWMPLTSLHPNKSGIPGIVLQFGGGLFCDEGKIGNVLDPDIDWPIVESFYSHVRIADKKHPPRVIIHPEDESSRSFFENSCSISFNEEPRILEGVYKPDKEVWEKTCKWIERHLDNFDGRKVADE